MGKTPSKSRKQLRSNAAPYVAKQIAEPAVVPAPVPIPVPVAEIPPPPPAPIVVEVPPPVLLERPSAPMLPTFDLRAIARTALGFAGGQRVALSAAARPPEMVIRALKLVESQG